ncbi:hypothetical protein BUALT_Bualt04G0090700 [Buddleja alternifolia]|uniref:GDP-D-glucose phosphorylase 1 n=1 Tax=Buddleja alternifolia TaxID=168488 RepID=A0AAV6XNT2_9LAMI|nr:hypothetical protein BUALT_Bualt04G0090700 [Buddleja alternifolia]
MFPSYLSMLSTMLNTRYLRTLLDLVMEAERGTSLKKRPTEFRVDKVLQPFDMNKFNFTKVGQEEVLFRFEPSKDSNSHYFPTSTIDAWEGSPSVVAINCYANKQACGEVAQELLDTQVNPAVWEIAGYMVLKQRTDYDKASEEYALRLLAEVSLSEERFQDVKRMVCKADNLQSEEEYISIQKEIGYESKRLQVTSHVPQDCLMLH